MSEEEIFKIKILALLHDPPWKPWIITSKIKGGVLKELVKEYNKTYYDKSEDVHENEGFTFAKLLGISDKEIDRYKDFVHKADRFSASVERYAIVGMISGQGGVVQQEWKYNVFNVNHKIRLENEIDKECIINYVKYIVDKINKINNWKDKYHALYALIEVAWYHFCPRHYPLADTRVSTYSVFDHLYATASMVNWFLKGDLTGYLVKIDLPAIQQIISRARKAWDFWGGSYLLSWLTYKTIEPLIDKYGVDVVLSPFMGLNPFFINSLASKGLLDKKVNNENTYWDFNDLMFKPTQPLMPATVLLALPKDNESDVKNEIKENYKEAWNGIVDELIKNNIIKDESIKKYLSDHPITPIRIRVINLEDELKKVNLKYDFSKFMYLLKLVNEDEKVIKVFYGVTANKLANDDTTDKYMNKELYYLCTSCGTLPAVPAVIDKDPDLEDGERLCQYCYMKRKLRRYLENKYRMQLIPSTIDIANIYNWRDLLKKVKDNKADKDPCLSELPKFLNENAKDLQLPDPLKDLDSQNTRIIFYNGSTPSKEDDRLMLKCLKTGSLKTEEIYYAIVKGDGDYIGKKLWRGIIRGKSFKDYVRTILNVKNINDKIIKDMENELKSVFGVNTSTGEIQIPVTPDYIITLSRGLMVIALHDAKTISKDGFLIYAGGDDIAFLAPISDLSALRLLKETRLNYWGASKLSDLTLPSSQGAIGFLRLGEMIFDAPLAYGRSYGVYITHYKDPFFYSWEIATKLEEIKDEFANQGKDVTIILRGRGELTLDEAAKLKNFDLEEVEKLYEEIKRKKKLSKSFIKDVLGDEIVKKCANRSDRLLESALQYYIKRNALKENINYTPPKKIDVIKAVDYFDDNYNG